MVEFTIGISLLIGMLFLVLFVSYVFNWEEVKIYLSCLVSGLALLSLILFCFIQKANGNPDQGMEFWQWYLPLSIYLFLIVLGIMSFITTINKVKSR